MIGDDCRVDVPVYGRCLMAEVTDVRLQDDACRRQCSRVMPMPPHSAMVFSSRLVWSTRSSSMSVPAIASWRWAAVATLPVKCPFS
jgi:hypothetical protein